MVLGWSHLEDYFLIFFLQRITIRGHKGHAQGQRRISTIERGGGGREMDRVYPMKEKSQYTVKECFTWRSISGTV